MHSPFFLFPSISFPDYRIYNKDNIKEINKARKKNRKMKRKYRKKQ